MKFQIDLKKITSRIPDEGGLFGFSRDYCLLPGIFRGNKVGAAFTTSGNATGGKETTMMSIIQVLLIYGMIIVGDPMSATGHRRSFTHLPMRAADAAKNTADLIEGTVHKVDAGKMLVTRANEAFGQVAESSSKVGELVAEIATASNEQAEGIGQVNTAVTEMDRVVQQNASGAEESASASEEMSGQAEQMKTMVGELVLMISGNDNGRSKGTSIQKKI